MIYISVVADGSNSFLSVSAGDQDGERRDLITACLCQSCLSSENSDVSAKDIVALAHRVWFLGYEPTSEDLGKSPKKYGGYRYNDDEAKALFVERNRVRSWMREHKHDRNQLILALGEAMKAYSLNVCYDAEVAPGFFLEE